MVPVSEKDKQCSVRNKYIFEIQVLINTYSEKLEYTLKLVTLLYTLDCNFLGFTNTKISR